MLMVQANKILWNLEVQIQENLDLLDTEDWSGMDSEAIGTEKNKNPTEPEGSGGLLNEDDEDDEMRLVKVNLRIIFLMNIALE